jgi:pimeloyl-ACP methyl ester carboxylesterase
VVFYLHGQPGCRLEQRLIPDEVLERFGVRLVSFDRPGYGDTDPLPGDRVARIGDLFTVADHLDVERFPLMAISAGGSYALTAAVVAPDRVERVVLAGGQMPYDDESAITTLLPDQLAMLPFLREGRTALVEAGSEEFRAQRLAEPSALSDDSLATMSTPEREFVSRPDVQKAFVDDMTTGLRASAEGLIADALAWPQPFEVDVRQVRCPVVAVHGDIDDWEPLANMRRILSCVPDSELIVLEGRNHLGPMLHPDLLVGLAVGR